MIRSTYNSANSLPKVTQKPLLVRDLSVNCPRSSKSRLSPQHLARVLLSPWRREQMSKVESLADLADHLDRLASRHRTKAGGVERDLASAKANAYADAARLVRAFALEGEVEVAEDELPERLENQLIRSREYQMGRWKVRVNYVDTDPEDQARRQAALLDVLARSMLRPPK